MQDNYNFIVINFNLNNIRKLDLLFEEILLVMSDNFAQTTFVVLKNSCANQININIRSS